jgi:two-component system heavy metal sensor histidine kinase CusS
MFWSTGTIKSSITRRLTILYASSTFIVLAVAIIFLYQVLVNTIEHDSYQFLDNEVTIIANILKKQPTISASLQQEVQWEPTTVSLSEHDHSPHHYIRVSSSTKKVLIETPGLLKAVEVKSFPAPSYSLSHKIAKGKDGQDFMLVSIVVPVAKGLHPFIIQIALDVSHQQAIIENYQNRMVWVLLLGVFLSAFLGAFVAKQGMRPLGLITEKLKHVDVKKLHERLLVENFPRELVGTVLALNNMLARLEDAFQRLSDFSSNLAHELRTPINSLMVQAEVALAQERSTDDYRETLISILEENQRLSTLIDRLLFLARAENPKMHVKQDNIALHELIDACKEFYEAVAEEKNIKVIRAGVANFNADSLLLQRAINNLLSNALYYTEPGGCVTFTILSSKESVQLTVVDTGVGISQEHIHKLFDRFYRVDDARARHSGGTGLGLAIVKTIMDLHHGHIAIISKPGDGTTITLTFPLVT